MGYTTIYSTPVLNRVTFTALSTAITTTSTTQVMAGLAQYLTIKGSGIVDIHFMGNGYNTNQADGVGMQLRYGTGTAPTSGTASTGTAVGNMSTHISGVGAATGSLNCYASISGLSVGTRYWFDLGWYAISANTANLQYISGYVEER